jgi:phage-related minor tail protein
MRAALEGPLAAGADRAGRAIETTLARAVRTGKLGFEDLRSVALAALGEIAASALQAGIGSLVGGAAQGTGGLGGGLASVLLGALGAPGRATGGPVSPGRPFWVGERGPELFVPTAAGSVVPAAARGSRDVRVSITVNTAGEVAPAALARSSRQVARAVKASLAGMED